MNASMSAGSTQLEGGSGERAEGIGKSPVAAMAAIKRRSRDN